MLISKHREHGDKEPHLEIFKADDGIVAVVRNVLCLEHFLEVVQPRPWRAHQHNNVAVIVTPARHKPLDLAGDPFCFGVARVVCCHSDTLHRALVLLKAAAADQRLSRLLIINVAETRRHQRIEKSVGKIQDL